MKLNKKDVLVALACGFFLLANLGAISQSGRQQAMIALCASNMRQASKAIHMFADDSDGFIPPLYDNDPGELRPRSSLGRYVLEQGLGLIVAPPYGWATPGETDYLPDAESLICPADKPTNHNMGGYYHGRVKGGFWGGRVMSYIYAYFTPYGIDEYPLYRIPRYRVGASPGKAAILVDQGDWPDWPDPGFELLYPPYHEKAFNTLHLDGRVNSVNNDLYQEKLQEEILKYPTGNDWFWVPRFVALDNM